MKIQHPGIITSRLMPGIKAGDLTISIEWSHLPPDPNRSARWHYAIDHADGGEYEGHDLQAGMCREDLNSGLETLLSFMLHAAEVARNWNGDPTIERVFNEEVDQWCLENETDLQFAHCDLQDPIFFDED